MRIEAGEVIAHSGALPEPIANARGQWRARRAAILVLYDDAGHVGLGEASPLPGWSEDTVDEASSALSDVDWTRIGGLDPTCPLEGIARISGAIPRSLPSARFAVESALLDLVARRASTSIRELLAPGSPRDIAVATLIFGSTAEERIARARNAVAGGASTLKLKLGLASFKDDLAFLAALRRSLPRGIKLRLDFNGGLDDSLSCSQLGGALQALARFDPELVEEPMSIGALLELDRTPLPIALDESLVLPDIERCIESLAKRGIIRALVLKPMLLGGIFRTLDLARFATDLGLAVIVSHLFDGPVALAAYLELARAIGDRGFAHGLAPHAGLAGWEAR